MRRAFSLVAASLFAAAPALAQPNAGDSKPNPEKPFTATTVATFDTPWSMAFLPDGRMLVAEKPGHVWLVAGNGAKIPVAHVPEVLYKGQAGLFVVALSPTFAKDYGVYLTYAEPGAGGAGLALARATLAVGDTAASFEKLRVIWRQLPKGEGGQFGGYIAFPKGEKRLYLTVGERQRFTPAQDPDSELGKILRLTYDGKPAPGNPKGGKGPATVPLFAPPKDTEAAKAVTPQMVRLPGPNRAREETYATGFRTPYGLAFDAQGRLWEVEHGPRGGDELNLIEEGRNYGWPLVSFGNNYNGVPIPKPDTRPDLAKPALYWNPVIAPASLTFYDGALFPAWRGSAFVGGLGSQSLVRIAFAGEGKDASAREAERWAMGARIRFTAQGPDGALYLLEDAKEGKLLRLTPKG